MKGEIKVTILHLAEDDPKKNTALRLEKHNQARIVTHTSHVPKQAVLLNPFAKKALSAADLKHARKYGLVAVDCSWKQADAAFGALLGKTQSRALPVLWAANPVNWGKPTKLTTGEAIGAALHILGETGQAKRLLRKLPFGEEFLKLNQNPLADYGAAEDSAGVVAAQALYLDEEE